MKAKVIETGEIVEVYREPQRGKVSNIFREVVFVSERMWKEDELDFCIELEEFPEKIYTYGGEYILINTFIDKACQFIKERYHKYCSWNTEEYELVFNTEGFIEDFKDYMKGINMKKKIILSLIALILVSIPFTFVYISIASNNETTFSDKMASVAVFSMFYIILSTIAIVGVLSYCDNE